MGFSNVSPGCRNAALFCNHTRSQKVGASRRRARDFDAAVAAAIWFTHSRLPSQRSPRPSGTGHASCVRPICDCFSPRLLRFLTTHDLTVLDRASIPEEPMNLSLLSTQGASRREVLVSDLGVEWVCVGPSCRPTKRTSPCLLFELMDPLGSLELDSVLHFPHSLTAQDVKPSSGNRGRTSGRWRVRRAVHGSG
jgi:hypothetical protein